MDVIYRLTRDERGQDLIEYALLSSFITLTVILAATNIGQTVNTIFDGIGDEVDQIPTS